VSWFLISGLPLTRSPLLKNSFLPLFPCRRQRIRTGIQPLASRPCGADLRHVELHDRPSVPLHDARVTWRPWSSPVSPSYQAIIGPTPTHCLYSVGPCPSLTWRCRLHSTSGRTCTFIFRTHATGSIIQSVIHSLLDLRYTTSVPFIMDEPTLSTRRPLRSNSFLWYMRIVQALMAAVVIGITGSNASDWHSWKCNLPSRLTYNIACVRRALFDCFLCLTYHVTGIRNPTNRPLSHLSFRPEDLNLPPSLG